MKKWKILSIVLAVLLVFVGVGGYFYSQMEYQEGLKKGLKEGQANLEAEVEKARKAGYQQAQGEVEKAVKELGFSSIEEAKAKFVELLKAPKPLKPLRNPTRQELLWFLFQDPTSKKVFDYPSRTTFDFAREVRENAQKEGIRVGIVYFFMKDHHHFINCFEPADEEGILYFEPQRDRIVKVKEGESYRKLNGWPQPPFDDTIIRICPPIW